MHTRLIRQFLAVAEAQNFRKAAERLHMAQPPLSVAIKRMEEELGGPLFLRERRGVRLTALGEAILEDARQVAFHADQLRQTAKNASTGLTGTLRVGFVGSATYSLLPRALPVFRERYPLISLELRERTTTQVLREIEADQLDLGLVRYPILEPTNAAVVPVERDTLMLAISARHPLARRRQLTLSELATEPFLMYSSVAAQNLRGQVMLACQAEGFTPKVVQEAVQIQTIVSLVECAMGVALVPSVARRHAPPGVVFKAIASPAANLSVALAVATRLETEPLTAARLRGLLIDLGPEDPPFRGFSNLVA
ncbi:MAG: LysR family transcriptional regulator [Pigmentiphaga sp.]